MGIRNPQKEEFNRLKSKTLDDQFLKIISDGLGCSAFEAEAVLAAVKEVYFPDTSINQQSLQPGQIKLVCLSCEEPAGKAISECEKTTVVLTVHRGSTDDALIQKGGTRQFRRERIPVLCQEALSQGGLLTREDLAYRVFYSSVRTISRDLTYLRTYKEEIPLPLRSTVHDIGPVLTHRVKIIKLALSGKTTTEICTIMNHSTQAINNYLNTFLRCAYLAKKNFQVGQIAFLLKRGRRLITQYLELLKKCESEKVMSYHLEELMKIGSIQPTKKTPLISGRRHV